MCVVEKTAGDKPRLYGLLVLRCVRLGEIFLYVDMGDIAIDNG